MGSRDTQTFIEANPQFQSGRIRLSFPDPDIEREFWATSLNEAIGVIRFLLILGLVTWCCFGILDAIVEARVARALLVIRYGCGAPFITLVILLCYSRHFNRISDYVLGGMMLVTGLCEVVMAAIMSPPFNATYYAGVMVIIMWCTSTFIIRYQIACALSFVLFVSYELVAVLVNPISGKMLLNNNFFLVMTFGVAAFAAYTREVHLRRTFVNQKLIAAKSEAAFVAQREAENASRSKSDFLANMSHELRTPLNAIIGFSEILQQQMFGPIGSERYSGYIDDIHNSGRHLLAVINDILDLAKAESGKMTLEESRADLTKTLRECSKMVSVRAAAQGVTLVQELPAGRVAAVFDTRLSAQIAINLLSNAIKFTPQGGSVTLALTASAQSGIAIAVSDTGIGIAPENIERVLRPFEQVESALSRRREGTGLGLPLSRTLAQLHGGTLTIDSELGIGTRVTVTLPPERLVRETPAGPAQPVAASAVS